MTRLLNANVNDRTKVAPAQILFGNAINLDRGILIPFDETTLTHDTLTTATSKMLTQQDHLMRIARENLLLADSIHNSGVANNLTEFAIDSYVLALPRTQPLTRLHPQWSGPYRVIEHDGGKYTVLDLITNKHKMYHVTQLKQFNFDPASTDPSDVARKDHLAFFIEEILSFKGDIKRVSTLTFRVKWLGYDETQNTWEPWRELMNNEKLHEFLIKVNLRNLIPRKYLPSYPTTTSMATTNTEHNV